MPSLPLPGAPPHPHPLLQPSPPQGVRTFAGGRLRTPSEHSSPLTVMSTLTTGSVVRASPAPSPQTPPRRCQHPGGRPRPPALRCEALSSRAPRRSSSRVSFDSPETSGASPLSLRDSPAPLPALPVSTHGLPLSGSPARSPGASASSMSSTVTDRFFFLPPSALSGSGAGVEAAAAKHHEWLAHCDEEAARRTRFTSVSAQVWR